MTGVFEYNRTFDAKAFLNLNAAWEKYIRDTYRIPPNDWGAVACELLAPTQDRQQYTLAAVEKLARSNKQEVIHVDWRYTPNQAAAPAPPTPSAPVASGQKLSPRDLAKNTTTRTYNGAPAPAAAAAPPAAPVNATAITGVYNGDFRCARGPVNLKLTLVAPGDGSLTGLFTFDLPAKFVERTASYTLSGTYDAATGHFRVDPVKWVPPEPANFVMVGMDGALNSSAERVSGKITYGRCTTFEASRDKAQSAALPHPPAVTPSTVVARSAPANANQISPSAAGHTAQAAAAAQGTSSATSAPEGQDPRLQQLPERYRRTAMGEGKGYCHDNEVLSKLFDCECFGKIVLDYRIAHVKEYFEVPRNSQGTGGWMPLTTLIGVGEELNCSECISEKTSKWAEDTALRSTSTYSDSDKKFMTACVSKNFVANFRAKPYLSVYQQLYAQALQSCLKQLKH
jgi:hypothetical protein